ncbi:MAG: hypothetical protein V3S18_04490, partial [Dehalococcoidia bacterium]
MQRAHAHSGTLWRRATGPDRDGGRTQTARNPGRPRWRHELAETPLDGIHFMLPTPFTLNGEVDTGPFS